MAQKIITTQTYENTPEVGQTLTNSQVTQAAGVITAFFDSASQINILADYLQPSVYANNLLILSLNSFIRIAGNQINIAIKSSQNIQSILDSEFINKIFREKSRRATVKIFDASEICQDFNPFIVTDQNGYYINLSDNNQNDVAASLNEPLGAERLQKLFNKISKSTELIFELKPKS